MARLPTEQLRARASSLGNVFSPDRSQVACLTNGNYTVRLSARGSGYSDWHGIALSRWSENRVSDIEGYHLYLRDLDDYTVWSAGYQPTRVLPDAYEFHPGERVAVLRRIDHNIECWLTVCVAPHHDCELRLCRLKNHGSNTRRIELTSYLEWVLTGRDADANHPAFSKLFVETSYCAASRAIFARRRPRSSDESPLWGFHALVREACRGDVDDIEFETNRAAFIGRGRSLATPRSLDAGARLTGQAGPVLDPIASLRTGLELAPGETREMAFFLGAAPSRERALEILSATRTLPQIHAIVESATGPNLEAISNPLSRSLTGSGRGVMNPLPKNGAPAAASGRQTFAAGGERYIVHPPHQRPGMRGSQPAPQDECLPAAARSNNDSHTRTRFETPLPVPHRDRARGYETISSVSMLSEPLQFDNGHGGFSADGREYVIRLRPDAEGEHRRPPMPWVNVIANKSAGFIVSESGAGYTWAGNSRLNRLTAWHNDPVCDPHSEAIWIRDEDRRAFWSVAPGPTPSTGEYVVRHGFGYTTFLHESHELSLETTMFIPPESPVKITRVRLVNQGAGTRHVAIVSYAHWALGALAQETARSVTTTYDAGLNAIFAMNVERETYGGHVAFSAVTSPLPVPHWDRERTFTCDRAAFLGETGDITAPAALTSLGDLDGKAGGTLDPCAAWQVPLELAPGEACECVFLLGEAANHEAAAVLLEQFRAAGRVDRALQAMTEFWRGMVSAVEIETPDREIDLLVNGWLTYQNLSCRMWARSAYYQPGGAFGFRDQLQDAAALVLLRPDITRAQILRHASQQFLEGDVLHWWHPDTGYGLRTRFSDDLLWLPYVTSSYAETTGDEAIWGEETAFLVGPQIAEGHAELYLRPADSGVKATIYEHCCRAVDRSLTAGPHGLPLIGCGDWNDGFSRVGRLGRGESVWLGFFLHSVLGHLLPVCEERGDDDRCARYRVYREQLAAALNFEAWDGAWYRRAYYDDGEPIGSAASDECQIDAIAQAWGVLSGVAPADRARAAIDAALERLVCREAGLIKLLTPPFDQTPNDPGYIKGYVPGIRENGGQYTHGVLWVVRALAEMGRGTAAVELLKMLSPVWHTASQERTDVYQTEPYVMAADVYGEPPHVGRGGWTWYTGSAGWMFRVAVESIFGLSIDRGEALVVKPAISASWPRCRLTYRLPGEATRYQIEIENPHGHETGVVSAALDGAELMVEDGAARIPLTHDGELHRAILRL